MKKLTQAEVKAKADEWAAVEEKIARAERARNDELDPYLVEYNEKTEPIRQKHEKKINSLRTQADELKDQVLGWLNGVGKPVSLEGEKAVAEAYMKEGSRSIDARAFFDLVKAKGAEFWSCLRVEIGRAERFLGKTEVDRISTKETKLVASLKLK